MRLVIVALASLAICAGLARSCDYGTGCGAVPLAAPNYGTVTFSRSIQRINVGYVAADYAAMAAARDAELRARQAAAAAAYNADFQARAELRARQLRANAAFAGYAQTGPSAVVEVERRGLFGLRRSRTTFIVP